MDADQELRSLKRGLKALSLLNQVETMGVSELARRLDLPRTTAERILMTLATEGYVHRLSNDKRYRLSAKVCTLSCGFSDDSWIVHVATPMLFDLTKRIGWPLAIATPAGEHMVLRLTTDPATSLWLHRRRIGAQSPRLGGSSGLVSMAFANASEREQLLPLLQDSTYQVNRERAVSADYLEALLAPVRENGYAFEPPPTDLPEGSISVPIFIDGAVPAVLLMMYMPRALRRSAVLRDYLPMLKALAQDIGARAGHHDAEEDPAPQLALPSAALNFGSNVVTAYPEPGKRAAH